MITKKKKPRRVENFMALLNAYTCTSFIHNHSDHTIDLKLKSDAVKVLDMQDTFLVLQFSIFNFSIMFVFFLKKQKS